MSDILLLDNAKILPLKELTPPSSGKKGVFDGGVYDCNGDICDIALHGKTNYINSPIKLSEKSFFNFDGVHVFGGMLQAHFGHFLTESIGRIWAFDYISKDINSLVFYHRKLGGEIPSFAKQIFDILLPHVSVTLVTEPSSFEELVVPSQVQKSGVLYGNKKTRKFFSKLNSVNGKKIKNIYVSRSRLDLRDGGILFEELIEKKLSDDGYIIIYPELMSIEEQLSYYKDAERIIFSEGSAIHLYSLVAQSFQKVFIIWRRRLASHFIWQIQSFSGVKNVVGNSSVQKIFIPPQGEACGRAIIDFEDLSLQLSLEGFISNKKWENPSSEIILGEIDRIKKLTNRNYC